MKRNELIEKLTELSLASKLAWEAAIEGCERLGEDTTPTTQCALESQILWERAIALAGNGAYNDAQSRLMRAVECDRDGGDDSQAKAAFRAISDFVSPYVKGS